MLNKDFIDATLRIADMLDLRETIAAEYVLSGTQNSLRFDREPYECALYLYQTDRSLLLDILRIVMTFATDEALDLGTRSILQDFVTKLKNNKADNFALRCLRLMRNIEEQSISTEDAERRSKLFGEVSTSVDASHFSATLLEQHESLAITLGFFCRLRPDATEYITELLQSLKKAHLWSVYVSHQVLVIMLALQAMSLAEESQIAQVSCDLAALAETFRTISRLLKEDSTAEWHCQPICSVLQMIFVTELTAICKEHEQIATMFDYENEIAHSAREAIDHHVFQNMITFSLFVHQDVEIEHAFRCFLRKNAFEHYENPVGISTSKLIAPLVLECYRTFVQNFIVHLADLLKEMHLKTEDSFAVQELAEHGVIEEEYHQEDLFYGVVCTAYSTGNDVGRIFWEDPESDLYGFLAWASHASVPSTIYSFFKMISAISEGPQCSVSAKDFFDGSESLNTGPVSLPSPTISWHFIFDSLRYYIGQLDPRQGFTAYKEPLEIDVHNVLILEAYISSLHVILSTLPETDSIDGIITKYDASTTLFQLLNCRLPPELYSAILRLLASFARSGVQKTSIWQAISGWLASTGLIGFALHHGQEEKRSLNPMKISSPLSVESSTCLIDLFSILICTDPHHSGDVEVAEPNSTKRFLQEDDTDYVKFVYRSLSSVQVNQTDSVLRRVRLSLACVKFMQQALESLDLDFIHIARAGLMPGDSIVATKVGSEYLKAHAGSKIMSYLTRPAGFEPLFEIIRNHDAADQTVRERLLPLLETALDVCSLALMKADLYDEVVSPLHDIGQFAENVNFKEIICNDTDLFVHLCLVAGCGNVPCSYAALKLLVLITQKMTENASKVYLRALDSVDQSKAILLGLVNLIDQRENHNFQSVSMLLDSIKADLERGSSNSSPRVSHFLLGFTASTSRSLSIGQSSGEIGSGHSIFHSLVAFLELDVSSSRPSIDWHEFVPIRAKITRILLLLCEAELTRAPVTSVLHESGFDLATLFRHSDLNKASHRRPAHGDIVSRIDRMTEHLIHQRTNALRFCSTELLAYKTSNSLTNLQEHLAILISSHGQADTFNNLLIDYLDVLQLDISVPTPKTILHSFDLESCNKYLLDATSESLRQLQLLVDLKHGVKHGGPAAELQESALQNYLNVQGHLALIIERIDLRKALLSYMREWTSMLMVFFHVLDECQHEGRSLIAYEICQHLLNRLPIVQDIDSRMADAVAEAISIAISWATKNMSSGDLFLPFFKKIIVCLQYHGSTYTQRDYLYNSGFLCLQAMFKAIDTTSARRQILAVSKSGIDQSLGVICQDTTTNDEVLKLSACVFLDLLLQVCEDTTNSWLTMSLINKNFLDRIMHHFESLFQTADSSGEILDTFFSIVLRLSMTRAGAREIAAWPNLLIVMAKRYFHLEGTVNNPVYIIMKMLTLCVDDDAENAGRSLRLLGVYVSCAISLGPQLNRKLLYAFSRDWAEKLEAHCRRLRKARNSNAATFAALLEVAAELSRESPT